MMIRTCEVTSASVVKAKDHGGALEVGEVADFVILDRDLSEIPEDDIGETKVLRTVLVGRTVCDRGE